MRYRRDLLVAAAVSALIPATQAAAAEDQSVSSVEEVVVTATRREVRLQDVPLSVTAISQEKLTARGIVGYEGLAHETPGIVLNKPSANFVSFTARGVATNSFGSTLQSTVAIYIDELPISTVANTVTLDPNLYDVERVEFLRGPQGTLFGSGSLAGALRILTKRPDLGDFDASALVDFGVTDGDSLRQRYNGMINMPLIDDRLALRVVGFYRDEEGYIDNLGTGVKNSNTLVDWGGRASLLWSPTDRLSVLLRASYEDSEPKDASLVSPALGRNKRSSAIPDVLANKQSILNATVEYQFDGAQLTSSSTYAHSDQKFFVDLSGALGGAAPFNLNTFSVQKTFVEEARLVSDPGGRFDWVIGGFYLNRRFESDVFFRSSIPFLTARGITGPSGDVYQTLFTYTKAHELAAFGELTYRFNDQLWVTGGVRYGKVDEQRFTEGGFTTPYVARALARIPGPLPVTPTPASVGVKAKESQPSFKVSVSYKPSSTLTTYATVSTGFRTPVVNLMAGAVSVVNPADLVIPAGASSDDLINYEIGLKGRWLDGRLTANLAAYWIDWSNIQIQANRASDAVQFATNIGAATSKGLEVELMAYPADGLTIGLSGSLNEGEVTELSATEAAISGAVVGARLSSPHVQGSLFVDYGFDLTAEARAKVSVVVQHVGSFPQSFPNVPGNPTRLSPTYGFSDSYENVNATFAVAMNRLTLGVYVENLFDDQSITFINPSAFQPSRFATLRPRTVGVRMGYDF